MEREWPDILYTIFLLQRPLYKLEERHRRKSGLDSMQHYVLLEMYRIGETCEFERLVKNSLVTKSSLSRKLIDLEKKGLVRYSTAPGFVKKKVADLTPQGMEYVRAVVDELSRESDIYNRCMTEKEHNDLIGYLQHMYHLCMGKRDDATSLMHDWFKEVNYVVRTGMILDEKVRKIQAPDEPDVTQKYFLLQILKNGGTCTFKELEKAVYIEQSGTAKQLRKMEADGLVVNAVSLSDKRVKITALTEQGRECAERYLKKFTDGERNLTKGLTKTQKKRFAKLIQIGYETVDMVYRQTVARKTVKNQ